jgi:hypothetical protein
MTRQYFTDTLIDPPIANLTAVVATSETALWNPANYSPIAANDARPGKIYQVKAGGIMSFATTGSLTITPRWGLTTGGITLGANVITFTAPGAGTTANAWYLEFTCIVRTVGAPGANSTVVGTGFFIAGDTATASCAIPFGGTSGTVDVSVATGLCIGWTLSVAGTITPQWVVMQSLN